MWPSNRPTQTSSRCEFALGEGVCSAALTACLSALTIRLRLARMNEEMKESEGPFGQPGQYAASSPTEQQYRKCIQEFICLAMAES